jgi:hypothetical protein
MKVKWFSSKAEADRWAYGFAYARRRSGLKPLTVVAEDGLWAVDNPDYDDPAKIPASIQTLLALAARPRGGR